MPPHEADTLVERKEWKVPLPRPKPPADFMPLLSRLSLVGTIGEMSCLLRSISFGACSGLDMALGPFLALWCCHRFEVFGRNRAPLSRQSSQGVLTNPMVIGLSTGPCLAWFAFGWAGHLSGKKQGEHVLAFGS